METQVEKCLYNDVCIMMFICIRTAERFAHCSLVAAVGGDCV